MIKSTIRKRTYQAIYRLLDRVSPLDGDCGELCGAACCTVDRDRPLDGEAADFDMGIYLLPGEDKVHDKRDPWLTWCEESAEDYDFPESWKGKVYFVKCGGPGVCKRGLRPMQCRTFPLAPHIDEEGELSLVYNDMNLPYRCPLIDEEMPLTEGFVQATFTVWRRLIEDPLIYDLVAADSRAREEAVRELGEML